MFEERTQKLKARLVEDGLEIALITDDDSVYYFSGFYDYLHMDFGRPTILVVLAQGAPILVTPNIELEMAQRMTWIEDIRAWQDGEGSEWRGDLQHLIEAVGSAA
ncbi:MAG: aminopeptidase P family N-terminal domain-containing protein, partial [Gammaproteobacteria bacterium]|nr:aminopeptidase P family N-terminal domain-containing protein [Gammaproteobacteria bacterium]